MKIKEYSEGALKSWNKSQRAILDSSKQLFWKHGISRVTVDEIAQVAELSKMTFYRYFKNKFEVAKIILEKEVESGMNRYDSIMNGTQSFRDKMSLLMEHKRQEARSMSPEFLNDLYRPQESMKELVRYLQQAAQESLIRIKSDFEKAQKVGEIRASVQIDFVLFMMQSINTQMENPALRQMFSSTEEMATQMMDFFLHGVINQETE